MDNSPDVYALSRAELIALLQTRADADDARSREASRVAPPPVGLYADIYDALPIGVVATDPQQRIVRCNAAFAAMIGTPPEKIVGRFGPDFFHPDSPPADRSAVADLHAGRRLSYSVDRLLRGPDGAALAVQLDWAPIRGEAGRVEVLVCAVTDVSVAARTTADLRRARERADVLWQRAPVGIIESTPDGVITSVNPALGAMLGRDPDELIGTSAAQLSTPSDAPAIEARIRELARSGKDSSAQRFYVSSDGRSIPVHVSATALVDEQGAVDRVTGFVVDVTEAHTQRVALAAAVTEIELARDELARRQHFTDALLATIDVGIVSCDADGTNLLRNSAERGLLDLTGPLAQSATPAAAAASIDVFDAAGARVDPQQYPLARALRGERVTDTDFTIGPRGGPHRDVVMRGSRITAPDTSVLGAVVAITDVTAERAAVRELAAERARLSQAQRLGQIGSYSYDRVDGRYRFSPELFRIWGLPPDADLVALSRQMIHPEDRARVLVQWEAGLRVHGEHSIDYRIVRPDGSVRHLRVSREVHLDPAGHAVAWNGTHLDVTDLTVARLQAVEANALLTAILAATPDYTFVINITTGVLVYGSPNRQVLGRTTQQIADFGAGRIPDLVHPDDQSRVSASDSTARDLADGEVLQFRYQGRHLDGSWHWLDRRVTPFHRDPVTGQVQEVLGVLRDVTDEHETELALRDQEARFRALVTQVTDYAIIGLDPSGVINVWNDGAERVKGYTAEQAVGQHFSIFYPDHDREAGRPGRSLERARGEGRMEDEGWRVRADGSQFWAHVVITALHDDHGLPTGFVKVIRDLTAQHRLEEARDSFFAAVTHDLKTPIITIKMFADLMADVDAATQLDYAQRIAKRADHLGELVNNLFDYAKIRSQSTTMVLEPLPLAQFMRAIVEGIAPALQTHPVTVENSDLVAWADRTAMTRILENLLANAAKYSIAGSPITVAFGASADVVRLSVTDEGRGIAPDDLDTIFDEFSRGRLAQDDGGTGLGLASVQRLAVQQGGRTWIDSELGHGTTITVELPRARETSHPAATSDLRQ